jgi:hypothetical protein
LAEIDAVGASREKKEVGLLILM